ncbi:Outer membrane protein assembly factor BamD [Sodalis praecaptivus]
MMRMKYLVAAATLSLVLAGCSSNKDAVPDNPPPRSMLPRSKSCRTVIIKALSRNWRRWITAIRSVPTRNRFSLT